jgi:hypothetical protein
MTESAPFRLLMAARNSMRKGLGFGKISNNLRLGIVALLVCVMLSAFLVTMRGASNPIKNSSPAVSYEAKPEVPAVTTAKDRNTKTTDACALIEKSEVAKVQNQKIGEAKSTTRDDSQFSISQCFYRAAAFERSVSLEVSERLPRNPDPNAVKRFWDERFERAKEKPKVVTGVGEKAYWVGNDKVGALYAFDRGRIVRVSVGGLDTEETRIQKSKTLVGKALKRLK